MRKDTAGANEIRLTQRKQKRFDAALLVSAIPQISPELPLDERCATHYLQQRSNLLATRPTCWVRTR